MHNGVGSGLYYIESYKWGKKGVLSFFLKINIFEITIQTWRRWQREKIIILWKEFDFVLFSLTCSHQKEEKDKKTYICIT